MLASSAIQDHVDVYLDLLDAREIAAGWTKDDVDESKPEPDLVVGALGKAATSEAFMIGETLWDVVAAAKSDLPTVCVLTGGFSRAELEQAGAKAVYGSPETSWPTIFPGSSAGSRDEPVAIRSSKRRD